MYIKRWTIINTFSVENHQFGCKRWLEEWCIWEVMGNQNSQGDGWRNREVFRRCKRDRTWRLRTKLRLSKNGAEFNGKLLQGQVIWLWNLIPPNYVLICEHYFFNFKSKFSTIPSTLTTHVYFSELKYSPMKIIFTFILKIWWNT